MRVPQKKKKKGDRGEKPRAQRQGEEDRVTLQITLIYIQAKFITSPNKMHHTHDQSQKSITNPHLA